MRIKENYVVFLKYVLISIVTTCINVGCFAFFNKVCFIDILLSNTISWFISTYIIFITNKKYVFHDNNKISIKNIINFYLTRVISLIIDSIVLYICVKFFNTNEIVGKIISNCSTTFYNYFIGKYLLFNNKEKNNENI